MSLTLEPIRVPIRIDEHGVARIGDTRVTLETVMYWYLEGLSPEAIQHKYPALSIEAIYFTIAYYLGHRAEVDAYLAQAEQESETRRAEIRARSDKHGIRERLLAKASHHEISG